MTNYNQAPVLSFRGQKGSGQFYQLPQELMDIVFNELGNSSAQIRIMVVLLGTKPGFKISEKWMLERTGLKHASYITARTALVNRGWIDHNAAKGITVNIDNIKNRGNTILPQETKKESSNTILPQRGNTILQNSSNTILPIINNTDKLIDNKENETQPETGSLDNPIVVKKEWLAERYNSLTTLANGLYMYGSKFYKIGGLPQ